MHRRSSAAALHRFSLVTVFLLAACGGGTPTPELALDDDDDDDGAEFTDCNTLFTARVQEDLAFCRNCHVAGRAADVENGRKFMLSATTADDLANLKASWERLGRNDSPPSRILTMAAGVEPHTGGAPWPTDSAAYQDMAMLLAGFEDPTECDPDGSGGTETVQQPLLDGVRGGNFAAKFCDDDGTGQPRGDDEDLPVDPRTLIRPGVNQGKAVAFNAYWRDCSTEAPYPANQVPRPTTCGEYRAQKAHGYFVGEGQGEIGTPLTFAGGQAQPGGFPAAKYNDLWRTVWGMSERPDNFDELIAERYGSPMSVTRNPYPLPGENPNAPGMNGGSGQLPLIFTQIRAPNGAWTGEIGVKVCVLCHNGQLGTEADGPGMGPQLGGAGSIGDFTVQGYDFDKGNAEDYGGPVAFPSMPSPTSAITISTNRGTGAIDFFQLAFVLFSNGDPDLLMNDKIVASQAIGNIKSPPWWNLAYRTQKFHGAVLHTDSSRIDLAAYYDLTKGMQDGLESEFTNRFTDPLDQEEDPDQPGEAIDWVDANAGPFQVWAESLPSPEMPVGFCSNADGSPAMTDNPNCINRPLAEAGATLFHSMNLWAPALNNPVPRPAEGNGSCASCHGAYSPRYTHDPAYLDRPEFAGIAAYTVPMSIVGTDPVYADAMQSLRNADGSSNESILKQDVVYCGLGNAYTSPNLTPIMLAPPLWGIWASAPYFHNGSVPNIEGVLDPNGSERPDIWRRISRPTPDVPNLEAADEAKIVMGYDTRLSAYDFGKLGWKYEALTCSLEDQTTQPVVVCNPDPVGAAAPNPVQALISVLYTEFGATWNLPRPEGMRMSQEDIENRKIFNTYLYSQGNQGHEFTAVLTEQQRAAIIEYLKTL